uniref:Zinc finger PHD-type domain-containing protein n=1 Tax=Percolomonas cosmopolitus TaxID=63605 RepID=A0A7S1PI96_9EUKA
MTTSPPPPTAAESSSSPRITTITSPPTQKSSTNTPYETDAPHSLSSRPETTAHTLTTAEINVSPEGKMQLLSSREAGKTVSNNTQQNNGSILNDSSSLSKKRKRHSDAAVPKKSDKKRKKSDGASKEKADHASPTSNSLLPTEASNTQCTDDSPVSSPLTNAATTTTTVHPPQASPANGTSTTYAPPELPFKVSQTLTVLDFGDEPTGPVPDAIPLDNIYPKKYRAERMYSDYQEPAGSTKTSYEVYITEEGKFRVTYLKDKTITFTEDNPTKAWNTFVEKRNAATNKNSKLSGPKQFGVTEDKVRRVLLSRIMRRALTDDEWTTVKKHQVRAPKDTDGAASDTGGTKEKTKKRKRKRSVAASGVYASAPNTATTTNIQPPRKNIQINEPTMYAQQQFYNPKSKDHYNERFAKHYVRFFLGADDKNNDHVVVEEDEIVLGTLTANHGGEGSHPTSNGNTTESEPSSTPRDQSSATECASDNTPLQSSANDILCQVCLDCLSKGPLTITCSLCKDKSYHTSCVNSEYTFANRDTTEWRCPRHYCCNCGDSAIISQCAMCPNAFCSLCEPMRMQEEDACCGFSLCKDCFAMHDTLTKRARKETEHL